MGDSLLIAIGPPRGAPASRARGQARQPTPAGLAQGDECRVESAQIR
jgi:hypothetical protein